MEKYILYDDETYNDETVFTGDDHRTLLETCCRHSSFFACCYPVDEKISGEDLLAPFQITEPDSIPQDILPHLPYCIKGGKEYPMRYYKFYRVCPELCDQLANITDSVYSWINAWGYHNPEDLYFYREDGSLFFEAIVHEGECTLYPREGEDISKLLTLGNWVKVAPQRNIAANTEENGARPATTGDAALLHAFYQKHSREFTLLTRSLDDWLQILEQSSKNNSFCYMINFSNREVCTAFRMRYSQDENLSTGKIAFIDQLAEKLEYETNFAFMDAEIYAKKQGCEMGILLGETNRQLWPIYYAFASDFFGQEYRDLLALCGRYCAYMSLEFPLQEELPVKFDALDAFEIPIPKAIVVARSCHDAIACSRDQEGRPTSYLRFFRICPQLLELMATLIDSAYGWCSMVTDFVSGSVDNRPKDPVFYRTDGSVFLHDVAHEYMCFFYPHKGEDATVLLSSEKWHLE